MSNNTTDGQTNQPPIQGNSLSTVSSAPGNRGKGRGRGRPGPAARQAFKNANSTNPGFNPQAHYQDSQAPKGTPRSGPKSRVEVEFKPGEFPILFSTTTATAPVDEQPVTINWASVLDASNQVHQDLQNTSSMEGFLAKKFQGRGDGAVQEFHRSFIASGVLCAGQNVINSVQQHDRSIGITNYLLRANISHVRSMRIVANQNGMFTDQEIGDEITTPGLVPQIDRCVRTASQVFNAPALYPGIADWMTEVRVRTWLPINNVDPSFDVTCRHIVAGLLVTHNLNETVRMSDTLPVLTGVNPPWWPLVQVADQPNFAPLFAARPAGGVAWLQWVNNLTAPALATLGVPAARAGAYVAQDLDFGFHGRGRVEPIIDKWAHMTKGMEEFFNLVDKTALAKSGSVAQLAVVETNAALITTISTVHPVVVGVASLQALFPSRPYTAMAFQLKRHVHQSAQRILSECRARWIQKDEKG